MGIIEAQELLVPLAFYTIELLRIAQRLFNFEYFSNLFQEGIFSFAQICLD